MLSMHHKLSPAAEESAREAVEAIAERLLIAEMEDIEAEDQEVHAMLRLIDAIEGDPPAVEEVQTFFNALQVL